MYFCVLPATPLNQRQFSIPMPPILHMLHYECQSCIPPILLFGLGLDRGVTRGGGGVETKGKPNFGPDMMKIWDFGDLTPSPNPKFGPHTPRNRMPVTPFSLGSCDSGKNLR